MVHRDSPRSARGCLRTPSRLRTTLPLAMIAAVAFAGAPCTTAAQEQASDESRRVRALTLTDAVERALERAPRVALSVQDVDVARASRAGASLRIPSRPHLQAEIRPNVDRQLGQAAPGYGAIAQVPFDVSGAPHARVVEAERRGDVALAELELARLEVRLATIEAYVRAKLSSEQVASAEDSLAIAARVLSATRRRAEAGAASDVDVTLAAHAASLAEAELEGARATVAETHAELATLLDLDPGEPIALTTSVDALPELSESAPDRDDSDPRHPSVRAIEARVDLLEATGTRLSRELAPLLGVYAGVDRAPASPVFGIVGIAVELPWGPRNQQQRAVAAAERDSEELRATLVDRSLSRSAIALRDAYEDRRAAASRLTTETVPFAERRLALSEEGFRLGRMDVFQVAMARDALVTTRQTRLSALMAAWQTWTALERALGGTR